ncbi:MAG: PAS domain S-box protein [Acidobacteria bacterium]|nr:PAS domain S-box protein [Acidobacteriota bacterium]
MAKERTLHEAGRRRSGVVDKNILSDAERARFWLAAIVNSSEDAIVSKDLNGIINTWNIGAERLFEYTAAEAVGKPITIIIPLELRHEETEILRRLRAGQVIDHFETVRVAKSGRRINISLTVSPIRDEQGRIIGASKIARDITRRVTVERALNESENRLRLAQAAAHIGTWEWDPRSGSSSLSPELHEIFDTDRAEPQHDQVWKARVHPDDLSRIQQAMLDSAHTGSMELEYRYYHPQRGLRWFFCKGRRFSDDDLRMFGIVLDITERKEAEERQRQSEEQFRALADSIAQLVWMAEADGSVVWYNRRWYEYTGTSPEQVAGWGWQSVSHPTWLPKIMERWKAALATGEPFEMEFPLRGADGVFRWFLTRAVPVREQRNRVVRWFGTNTNVHEQREANKALETSRQELNSALAQLTKAHEELEIRVKQRTADLERAEESLRALSGRLLQAQDEERRRIARELHDSAGQLLTALNMNLVPIQSEAHKLAPASVRAVSESLQLIEQLSTELRTISHLLHPPMLDEAGLEFALQWYVEGFAERSNIEVDFEFAPDLGRLSRDAEIAIFRLVQESLTNIHRHSDSATASVRVFREGEEIVARVSDQGRGMPAEYLDGRGIVKAGVGVQGMRERLRQLKGNLKIHSGPGGTTVEAILPAPVAQLSTPAQAV